MAEQQPTKPGLVALLGLSTESADAWASAASAIGATLDETGAVDACRVYARESAPLAIVAPGDRPLDVRLVNPADEAFRVATVIVTVGRDEELAYWQAVAWDAAPPAPTVELAADTLRAALAESASRKAAWRDVESFRERSASLSETEQLVFEAVCAGKLNKQMASEMSVSIRTVEQRRRRVFEKMGVDSAVPLAGLAAAVRAMESQARRLHRNLSGAMIPPPGRG